MKLFGRRSLVGGLTEGVATNSRCFEVERVGHSYVELRRASYVAGVARLQADSEPTSQPQSVKRQAEKASPHLVKNRSLATPATNVTTDDTVRRPLEWERSFKQVWLSRWFERSEPPGVLLEVMDFFENCDDMGLSRH